MFTPTTVAFPNEICWQLTSWIPQAVWKRDFCFGSGLRTGFQPFTLRGPRAVGGGGAASRVNHKPYEGFL